MLELSHLASDGGPASRAPVTVLVNGHVVRENFAHAPSTEARTTISDSGTTCSIGGTSTR